MAHIFWTINDNIEMSTCMILVTSLSADTMPGMPLPWPLTDFEVKFVAARETIRRISLFY